jgi:hypothetical protein
MDPEALEKLYRQDPRFIFPICELFRMQHEMDQPVLYAWEVRFRVTG